MNCGRCGTLLTKDNRSRGHQTWHICKSCLKTYYQTLWKNNPKKYADKKEEMRLRSRKDRHDGKIEAISHYSNGTMACANSYGEHKEPYVTIEALTLDRIVGGHKRSGFPTGSYLYLKLKREGYPEGWQVLCMNCQLIKKAKRHEYGGSTRNHIGGI